MSPFLIDTLLYTGALMLLVLVLRRPIAWAFGAQAAYALWALPLLRLLMPPIRLPSNWGPARTSAPIQTIVYVADHAAPIAAAPEWNLQAMVVALWLAGAAVFLAMRVITYRQMRARLLKAARPVGQSGTVRMVESPALCSPVAFGVIDKVIALPPGFMAWDNRRARDFALAHELAHHSGHNLLINIAAQPLLALHWFNPLAWAGWRAMRHDQEAACDARVLAGQSGEAKADYGRLIASLAGGPRLSLAAAMAGFHDYGPVLGEKSIIHRLRSLTMPERTLLRRRLGLGLIWGAALTLPLTATIGYAAPDMPPAPAAPAVPAAPIAPDAPAAPHGEKRVMIIEHRNAHGDPAKMKTRTITRDGKTVTFTTDEDLTDAQIDAKMAELEMKDGTIVMREGGPPPVPDTPGTPRKEVRRIIINTADGQTMGVNGDHTAMAMSDGARACSVKDGAATVETANVSGDPARKLVKVKICQMAHAKGAALGGLKSARDRIANDKSMSDAIRAEVVKSLDAEIAKMSKEG